jgi:ribosome-associated heat shock protein Hsp15
MLHAAQILETAMAPLRDEPEAVRIDRYIWAIRLCKTRSLATEICRAGHVKINGTSVKPAHLIRKGDRIVVTHGDRVHDVEVTGLLSTRVSAEVAARCYADHSPPLPSRDFVAPPFIREASAGRPTKRERRQLDRLRNIR